MAQNPQKSIEAIEGYAMVCSNAQTLLKVCQTPACLHHVIPCLPLRSFHLLRLMLKMPWTSLEKIGQILQTFHGDFMGQKTREPGLSGLGEPCLKTPWGSPSRVPNGLLSLDRVLWLCRFFCFEIPVDILKNNISNIFHNITAQGWLKLTETHQDTK